jgi:hypothetical protein
MAVFLKHCCFQRALVHKSSATESGAVCTTVFVMTQMINEVKVNDDQKSLQVYQSYFWFAHCWNFVNVGVREKALANASPLRLSAIQRSCNALFAINTELCS